jgi:hypothetical protein
MNSSNTKITAPVTTTDSNHHAVAVVNNVHATTTAPATTTDFPHRTFPTVAGAPEQNTAARNVALEERCKQFYKILCL